jgi:choline dehydrogenase-like flavoprotein
MNLLCISKIDQIRPQSVRSTTNRDRLVPIPWICTPKPKSPYTLAPEERIEVGNGGAHLANRLASAASFVVGRLELRHALRRRRPGVPPRGGRNPERTRLELRHALRRRRPGVPPRVEESRTHSPRAPPRTRLFFSPGSTVGGQCFASRPSECYFALSLTSDSFCTPGMHARLETMPHATVHPTQAFCLCMAGCSAGWSQPNIDYIVLSLLIF